MEDSLDRPLIAVDGIGPKRREMLCRAGIRVVGDLLRYPPLRYEDRSNRTPISGLQADGPALVSGEIRASGTFTSPARRVRIFEMVIHDGSGSLKVRFLNQPYLEKILLRGLRPLLFGVVRRDPKGEVTMLNPEYELLDSPSAEPLHVGRIVPIYRRIETLTTRVLRRIIFRLLRELSGPLQEVLPEELLRRHSLPDLERSLRELHFPVAPVKGRSRDEFMQELSDGTSSAHRRFIFEEFFRFQLGVQLRRRRREITSKKRRIEVNELLVERITRRFPFTMTDSQRRALKEILEDLSGSRVMNRMLQGDVGSGKTAVALAAMRAVVESGYQAVLMAPTEILAEQHYDTVKSYLAGTAYGSALLSSSVKGTRRMQVLENLRTGRIRILVGTHALLESAVEFKELALVVIDEQHRFGVRQRLRLLSKTGLPETLVMTATPIPRSLAMTLYGDLDLSRLEETPANCCGVVKTFIGREPQRKAVYGVVREELERGRQGFVIVPVIEAAEGAEQRAACETFEYLSRSEFPDFNLALIHGRLTSEQRHQLMRNFREGRIDLLVSTTVVEVGIDVPNATVMVIEHAERFGLSQLHQLRGRIGRGQFPGICVLMTGASDNGTALQRLEVLRSSDDGFEIAESDLKIRGPGELAGLRQSGIPEFVFGSLEKDWELMSLAHREAVNLVKSSKGVNPETAEEMEGAPESWGNPGPDASRLHSQKR